MNPAELRALLAGGREALFAEQEAAVRSTIAAVRSEGDAALFRLTERFDGVDLRAAGGLAVRPEEWDVTLDASFMESLQVAIENIRTFHEGEKVESWQTTRPNGTVIGQRVLPVQRAGIYVPGGSAPLLTCLLMTVIPAQVAGVDEIIICTPPDKQGRIDPHLLAAAKACGVRRVYKLGGAQAIAAMAYGTETVPAVDLIAGPGSPWVMLAKKLVAGQVGIDMLAGPTEVVVVDDGSEPVEWLAADLLSQAEHPNGMVILLTLAGTDRIAAVEAEMAHQIALLDRQETINASLTQRGVAVAVASLAEAAELLNRVAPEHLQLALTDPWAFLPQVRNAGAIFLGRWTPEAIGDYIAGPSNVIPTEGTARYTGPVSVSTFLKRSSVVCYTEEAFREDAPHGVRLAEAEQLQAHRNAMAIRLTGGEAK
jgi:histidinol dehydrogenase